MTSDFILIELWNIFFKSTLKSLIKFRTHGEKPEIVLLTYESFNRTVILKRLMFVGKKERKWG